MSPRAARPWFRFYVEAFGDPKVRELSPANRWLFTACLGMARQSCRPGWLMLTEDTPASLARIADFAALSRREVASGMLELARLALVVSEDTAGGPAWRVPRWNERQFESDDVTARTQKHRKERSNDVPGNGPDTDTDTDPPNPPLNVEFGPDPTRTRIPPEQVQQLTSNVRSLKAQRRRHAS